MQTMKFKISFFLMSLLMPMLASAQEINEPEMADTFRSNGKIYVVISVIAIVFVCLIVYLIYIDTRLKKLENKK